MGRSALRVCTHARRTVLAAGLAALVLVLAACSGSSATTHSTATAIPSATASAASSANWSLLPGAPKNALSIRFAPASASTSTGYLCALNGPAVSPLPATPTLYKTSNGGTSWQLVATPIIPLVADGGLAPAVLCTIFVDDHDAGDIFLQEAEFDTQGVGHAIARGLYRSRDGGVTWNSLATVDKTNGFGALLVLNNRLVGQVVPSVLGASACDGSVKPTAYSELYASDDGGTSWQPIGQSIEGQGYSPYAIAVAGSSLIAAASAVPAVNCSHTLPATTLWASGDGGVTWQKTETLAGSITDLSVTARATPTPETNCGAAVTSSLDASGNAQAAVLYWGGGSAQWRPLPALPGPAVSALAVTPSCTVLAQVSPLSGADLGIYVIHPDAPSPGWGRYAPGGSTDWQVTGTPTSTLWALGGQPSESGAQSFYQPEFLAVP